MNPNHPQNPASGADTPATTPAGIRRLPLLASWPAMVLGATLAATVLTACGPADGAAATAAATTAPVAPAAPAAPLRADPPLPVRAATVPVPAEAGVESVAERSGRLGRITAIEPIRKEASGTTGGVVGGVVGAVLGNQIGSGNGRAAATVVGGVGGALLGNRIQRKSSETVVGYKVHVQLDNGKLRSFTRQQLNGLDVGMRVRVEGKQMTPV